MQSPEGSSVSMDVKQAETFPYAQTPEFQQGVLDYQALVLHPQTGTKFTKGLRVCDGNLNIRIPAVDPESYAKNARKLMKKIKPMLTEKPIMFTSNLFFYLHNITSSDLNNFQRTTGPIMGKLEDLVKMGEQMTGVGKAALDAGDLRTAFIAFEAAGGLRNPQIKKAIGETMGKLAVEGKFPDMGNLIKELTQQGIDLTPFYGSDQIKKIMEEQTKSKMKERPKNPRIQGEVKVLSSSLLTDLVELKHSGTNKVYIVGGQNGGSILKIANISEQERFRIIKEKELLEMAKGAGGLPILEGVLIDPGYNHPRGIQMERVKGKSVHNVHPFTLTPNVLPLDNRLWLIHDLVDAYKATGVVHGDLMNQMKGPDGKIGVCGGNLDNLMLEEGTNRIRLIDYGIKLQSTKNFDAPKFEVKGIIDWLLLGKVNPGSSVEPPPVSQEMQAVGIEMLKRLANISSVEQIPTIIPEQYRIPGEDYSGK